MGQKTKVVLDTNVWIAIIFNKTLGKEFSSLFEKEKIEVFASGKILKELARVVNYPKIKTSLEKAGITTKNTLLEIIKKVTIVKPKEKIYRIKENLADNKFLECAVESEAEYIISGDKHLLNLKEYKGTKIVSARKFIEIMKSA